MHIACPCRSGPLKGRSDPLLVDLVGEKSSNSANTFPLSKSCQISISQFKKPNQTTEIFKKNAWLEAD